VAVAGEFEDKVTHSHNSSTQYYLMLYHVLWPCSTKLHTVHQCRIINREVYETIQSIGLESQVIIKAEYTPNESQLHEKIKSQPQKNWRPHKVGITCDKYTEANL